jgi:hypothetical protein
MVNQLINYYLSANPPQRTELFLYHEVLPGIGVGGSLDSIYFPNGTNNPGMIVDYKTTSSRTQVTRFPRPYFFQQLAYAYLCKQHAIPITALKLVYITTGELNRISEKTGKRLQDYPSIVYEVDHLITDEDWQLIDSIIKLVSHSVQTWRQSPELRYILAQDWRLAPVSLTKPKPHIFNRSPNAASPNH